MKGTEVKRMETLHYCDPDQLQIGDTVGYVECTCIMPCLEGTCIGRDHAIMRTEITEAKIVNKITESGIEYIIFHNKDGYVIEFTKEQAADNLVYLDDAAKKENELYALSLKCDRMIRDLENEVAPDGLPLFKLFWADEDSLNRIDELLTYLTQKYLDGKEKGETSAWTW